MRKTWRRILEIVGLRESERKIVKRRLTELGKKWEGTYAEKKL